MTSSSAYLLGAVAYDPKVVTIWDGFRAFLATQGFALDYVLFSNYERQVAALVAGQVNAAWSSPLAWIEAREMARRRGVEARAIAMRDTDQDLTSVIVGRDETNVRSLADLRGKRVAVGASDSPQATLIPLLLLRDAGLDPGRDVEILRFEVGVGLHGDHVGGERDAARALADGRCDAACMLDANHLAFTREGTLRSPGTRVLAQTPPFDHCNMTVIGGKRDADADRFAQLLLEMSWGDPKVRALLDLEGLRAWRPGRTSGYAQLDRAVAQGGALTGFLEQVEACA
jgi:ABC-type phosphate/phosphonate transport system substrate-binding protein